MFSNEAVVLGILLLWIAIVFQTEKKESWKRFYQIFPPILLCYFVPSLFNMVWFADTAWAFRLISGDEKGGSQLYGIVANYLLPSSLILLTISMDLKAIAQLGTKAVLVFLAGTVGVIVGAPLAMLIVGSFAPETVQGEVWRGLATIAGSWIGGSANQTAMKEVFAVPEAVFSMMIAVDVLVANVWMAFLLYGAGKAETMNRWLRADNQLIEEIQTRMASYQASITRPATLTDLITIVAIGFAGTGLSHACADAIVPFIQTNAPYLSQFSLTSKFFWVVVLATTFGMLASLFPSVRRLEGAGASKIGSVFLYLMIATIGMKMNVLAITENMGLFLVGVIWMLIHGLIIFGVARLLRAPFFFVAVGSQANIGGASSAPVVASAFHPSLASVGVLLAVLGYALGTYGGWLAGMLMQWLATP
ncbi:MAG: DUF819 family protein [Cytophagales bacterium]|nr:MAG: DUF819 family protein [Cytophagales bacterium]